MVGRRLLGLVMTSLVVAACASSEEGEPVPPSTPESAPPAETTTLPNEPAPAPEPAAPSADCVPYPRYNQLCQQRTTRRQGYLCSATYRAAGKLPDGCVDPKFTATSVCCP